MAKKTPHLLTVEQAATVAGLTSASITRYSTTPPPWGGCVPHVIGDNPGRGPKKVRLYPRSELERWLRQRETYFATLDAQREKKKKDRSDLRAVIARQGDELLDAQRRIIALEKALASEAAEVSRLKAQLQLQKKPTAPRTAPKAKADAAKARAKHRAEEAERREAEALARASEAERREAEALARASEAKRRADEIKARAKRRIIEAKREADTAGRCADTAEARADAAETRAAEAEAKAAAAEERAADAEARADAAEARADAAEAALRDKARQSTQPKARTKGRGRGQQATTRTNTK